MKWIMMCVILAVSSPAIAGNKSAWYTYSNSRKTCIQGDSPAEFIKAMNTFGWVRNIKDEFMLNGQPQKVTVFIDDGTACSIKFFFTDTSLGSHGGN